MVPKPGDLLIRTAPSRDDSSCYILLDAVTERVIAGPIPQLADALRLARETSPQAQLWQQFTDVRGRPTGPIMKLDAPL